MGKAVRPKTSQQLPSMGSRGRQRGRIRRRLLILVLIVIALASAGVWWGINQLQSTDNRSQASVDQSFRMRFVPQAGEPPSWEAILSARSTQAVVHKVHGFVSYPAESIDRSGEPVTPITSGRRVFENDSLIVTTQLPEPVSFAFAENEGSLEFTIQSPDSSFTGEPTLFQLWSRFPVEPASRSLWLIDQPSIRGFLQSNPGIELELLSREQKSTKPEETQCVSVVRRCPQDSAVTTTEQYPCGACLDKTGHAVGPIPPTPLPVAR